MAGPQLRDYLSYRLADAERRLTRRLSAALGDEGVAVEQWRVLRALVDGHGHSMGELADAVLVPHPTLTKMVDRMVSDALVYRRQDTRDRRRVAVYLSDRGRALLARLDALAAEDHGDVVTAFGWERTEQLMRSLEELLDVLGSEPGAPGATTYRTRPGRHA